MGINERVDEIIDDIESGVRFGNSLGLDFNIHWSSWDNRENRVIVSMFSVLPTPPLTQDDLNDVIARFNIVWGVRTYDKSFVGLFAIETLRTIDSSRPARLGSDVEGVRIIR